MSQKVVRNFAAQNIAELRNQSKMSRRALVQLMEQRGVRLQETSLKRIEDGNQSVKIEDAIAIADIFGQDLESFITQPVDHQMSGIMAESTKLERYFQLLLSDIEEASSSRKDLKDLLDELGAVQMSRPEAVFAGDWYSQSEVLKDMEAVVRQALQFMGSDSTGSR